MVNTSRTKVTYAFDHVTEVRTGGVDQLLLVTRAPENRQDTNAISQVVLRVAQATIHELFRPGETQVSQSSVCVGVVALQITS